MSIIGHKSTVTTQNLKATNASIFGTLRCNDDSTNITSFIVDDENNQIKCNYPVICTSGITTTGVNTVQLNSLKIDDGVIFTGNANTTNNLKTGLSCSYFIGGTGTTDIFQRNQADQAWYLKRYTTNPSSLTDYSSSGVPIAINVGAITSNSSVTCGNIISSGLSSRFINAGDTSILIGTSSLSYGLQNLYYYHGGSSLNSSKYIGAIGGALDNGTGGRIIIQTTTPAGVLTERMRIDSAGQMYFAGKIGTGSSSVAPFYDLQVGYSNTANTLDQTIAVTSGLNRSATLRLIELGSNGTDEAGFQLQYRGSDNTFYILSNGSAVASAQGSTFGSTVLSAQRDTLNVGIGKAPHATFKLDVSGSINGTSYFANGTSFSSDRRVKDNIEDANLDICYDNIKNIKLRRFEWNKDKTEGQFKDSKTTGIIAQEYELLYPKAIETVSRFGIDDFKMVNYHELYMATIGSVKKLIDKVEQLEKTITILTNQ